MAKAKVVTAVELSPEELAVIQQLREGKIPTATSTGTKSEAHKELAEAFVEAIERTKPKEKKTSYNRPKMGPWEPKDGTKKPKLRRVMYQHGLELLETSLHKEEIELLNKIKAGSYCGGFVRVIKRKDRSLDIDYPIKTASQRLKLVNQFGIRDFKELLQRIIDEAARPAVYAIPEDED
jgi:hypothetical protein